MQNEETLQVAFPGLRFCTLQFAFFILHCPKMFAGPARHKSRSKILIPDPWPLVPGPWSLRLHSPMPWFCGGGVETAGWASPGISDLRRGSGSGGRGDRGLAAAHAIQRQVTIVDSPRSASTPPWSLMRPPFMPECPGPAVRGPNSPVEPSWHCVRISTRAWRGSTGPTPAR